MKKLIAALATASVALGLGACTPMSPQAIAREDALSRGEAVLVTTAPDGTKLWMARKPYGGTVYFSTAGTQSREGGKHEHDVYVPTGGGHAAQ